MIKLTIEADNASDLIADLKQIAQDLRPLLPQETPKIIPARYVVDKESDLPDGCIGVHAKVVWE